MKTLPRKPLLVMIALGAALAVPAFAQRAQQTQQEVQDAAVQEQQQVQSDAAAGQTAPSTPAQSTASSGQQGWDDLDTDKDGAISKAESGANPALSQIFGQADADADGKLTQAEYKAFVVKNYGGGAGQSPGK